MAGITPVWFITAASSGFGREIAFQALKHGHTVVATARNPSRIQDLADAGAHTIAFDVTAPLADIESLVKTIFSKYGRVDYLINAAGFILEGAIEEVSPQEVYDSFNTNVFGAVNTIKAFLPSMRAQPLGPTGTRATIATFGSLASWGGGPSFGVYAMTKWCTSALAESLSPELAVLDIVATVIEPGYFRTGFLNPGAMMMAKKRVPAYEAAGTPTAQTRSALAVTDGKQLGDVKKGAAVIVDVLTQSGVAKGKKVPVRLVLGSDCEQTIRNKVASTVELLDEWKDITRSTDYLKGE